MIPNYEKHEYVKINGKRHYVVHPNMKSKKKHKRYQPHTHLDLTKIKPVHTI